MPVLSETLPPLRLGIAGCLAGRARYGAALAAGAGARLTPPLSVVGLTDTDLHSARIWAREIGGAVPPFATLDALLAAVSDLDALLIVSPLPDRPAHVTAAARAHKAILCEVPFAPTLAETEALLRLAADSGILLMPVLPHRFDAGFLAAAARVEAGELGEIRQLRCVWSFPVNGVFALEAGVDAPEAAWSRLLPAVACQAADVCRWWLGEAASISADGFPAEAGEPEPAREGPANLILTQARGRSTLHFSRSRAQQPEERYTLSGAKGQLDLTAQAGVASAPAPLLVRQRPGRRPERLLAAELSPTPRLAHVARMRAQIEHFAACAQAGEPPRLTGADARAAQEILSAAALSTQEGSKVSLPIKY
ncbi:MAG TPA: Gfo/Idh/MocA family oxidoreductase [Chthonomonadaceae bacterium]|nr:Gfo/Idh/MocA family oxidoreductase [Chthonomonadaceae bacterium]